MIKNLSIAPALLATVALGACAELPPGSDFPKQESVALTHPEDTALGRKFQAAAKEHPGDSGFRILSVGVDGFAARIQLIKAAERSLDLQYFIFQQDDSGRLVTDALLRAADRGVHLRVLIDDGATSPGDNQIRLLAAHPQIEIRIFNPFKYRGDSSVRRGAEYLAHHGRLDFRMHNKLIVADNTIALIGGRNIGNQYFQVDPESQFADDDVFVSGPTVPQLSAKFDEYWNSALAIPVEALAGGKATDAQLAAYRLQLAAQWQRAEDDGVSYLKRAASGEPLSGIFSGELPLVWSSVEVVCDSPQKKRVKDGSMIGQLMYDEVAKTAAAVQSELLMITPYFVPTTQELKLLQGLRDRNVKVRILTNSLESTTELGAQSGYARFRVKLLHSGVELYELRALIGNTRGSGETVQMARHGNYGLHAKLFVFDRRKLFIGSMNFDQRSTRINTEVGLIIDSPTLAQQTAARFDAMTESSNAYQVVLKENADTTPQLIWRTREEGQIVEYTREPSKSQWRRFEVGFLSLLPLDHEL
jgi:putative cardiolipin synthase